LLKKATESGNEEARVKYLELKKDFDKAINEANSELKSKNYLSAMALFANIVKVYGKELAPEVYTNYFKLRKDKIVIREMSLEKYLLKIQVAIDKKSVTKEKITEALNNFIKKYPKNHATQKAEKMLKGLE
jgi:hypothetical protein